MAGAITSLVSVVLLLASLVSSGPSTHAPTTKATTPKPINDIFEYGCHFYRYDPTNHFLCVNHKSRYLQNCICYHIPYAEREEMQDPIKLLTVQRRMYALYVAGHSTVIDDIRYYSPINEPLCTDHGRQPNVTISLVYD